MSVSDGRVGSVLPEEPDEAPRRRGKEWEEFYAKKGSIAEGGLGRVLRVMDKRSGAELALKEPLFEDDKVLRRFRREVDLQKNLLHHHVMPIVDAGDNWFVMPLAEATLAAKAPEMSPLEVVTAFEQAASGLQAAHGKGMVHRDVKPENILVVVLDGRRRWVISDFGLVRRPRGQTTGPPTMGFLGTRDFCSPEALAGAQDIGAPADIYSLGKALLWVLTGKVDLTPPKPWQGLIAAMTETAIAERPLMETVLRGLQLVRDGLRVHQRAIWGKSEADLTDNEGEVLFAMAGCLVTPDGGDQEMAQLNATKKECKTLLPGGVWIQIKALEQKGFISAAEWREAWHITAAGWDWLHTNQHRGPIKRPPPDDDIPF